MANIEVAPRKLVLKQGSTTLTLDKESGKATLQQKMLYGTKSRSSSHSPISTISR